MPERALDAILVVDVYPEVDDRVAFWATSPAR